VANLGEVAEHLDHRRREALEWFNGHLSVRLPWAGIKAHADHAAHLVIQANGIQKTIVVDREIRCFETPTSLSSKNIFPTALTLESDLQPPVKMPRRSPATESPLCGRCRSSSG